MPTPDQLHDINLKRLEHEYQSERQRVEFVQQFAHSGLKLIVLLNGGALVALFTLLGNLDKPAVTALALDESALRGAFAWLIAGLISACVAHLVAYVTQEALTGAYVHDAAATYASLRDGADQERLSATWFRAGQVISAIAVAAVIVSVICFCIGSYKALGASRPSRLTVPPAATAVQTQGPAKGMSDEHAPSPAKGHRTVDNRTAQ